PCRMADWLVSAGAAPAATLIAAPTPASAAPAPTALFLAAFLARRRAFQFGKPVGIMLLHRQLHLDVVLDFGQVEGVVLAGKAYGFAGGAQPGGATDTVNVIGGVLRQIE